VRVGDVCVVERRSVRGGVDARFEKTVTKLTPKRAYLGLDWFALDDPERELRPKYLDYRKVVVEVREAEKESEAKDGR
jgi:hypothetical protein